MTRSKLSLLILIVASALLVAMPLLAACQAAAPSPAPSPKPSPAPAPAPAPTPKPAAKSIELKWTIGIPDNPGPDADMTRDFATLVTQRTQGRVTVKVFWGSVLGKLTDYLKMVGEGGVAQGAYLIAAYNQWEIPLWAASGLPFLTKGTTVAPKATWALYNEWSLMQEEMKRAGVKPLGAFQPQPHIIGLKEPITSIDQLKGKKLSAFVFWPDLAAASGIVNVPLTVNDVYDALQKGTIAGVFGLPIFTPKMFKYYEITKYLVELPLGGQPVNSLVINLNVWNQIAPEDQKTIGEIAQDLQFNRYPKDQESEVVALSKFYKDNGVTEIKLSDAEYARMEKLGKDLTLGNWLKTAKEKGVPGEEWLQRYQAKVKEFSK